MAARLRHLWARAAPARFPPRCGRRRPARLPSPGCRAGPWRHTGREPEPSPATDAVRGRGGHRMPDGHTCCSLAGPTEPTRDRPPGPSGPRTRWQEPVAGGAGGTAPREEVGTAGWGAGTGPDEARAVRPLWPELGAWRHRPHRWPRTMPGRPPEAQRADREQEAGASPPPGRGSWGAGGTQRELGGSRKGGRTCAPGVQARGR